MINDVQDIKIGDKVFPVFGLDNPYIASLNPYYILQIEDDMLTWAYGGNCIPHKIKFGQYRLFKTIEDARKYCVEYWRVNWVLS